MDLSACDAEKSMSADKALSRIKNGSRVFLGTGFGEPRHLIRSLAQNKKLHDIMIYQMLSSTLAEFVDDPSFLRRFSIKLFFINNVMRKAAFEGKIDYIPSYLSQLTGLFYSRRIGLDVSLIQVAPPDRFGYCSLGISVALSRAAIDNSKLVIAQVNPRMPRTWGDTFVHVDEIDCMVAFEEPLLADKPCEQDPETAEINARIGHYVSQLVDDGATLQIGLGNVPYSILQYLENKKNLGVHTQMITDAFIPLMEKKVINNKKKTLLPGKAVASLCMGSEALYRYVDDNPLFYFSSSKFVNDPSVIAQNDNLISISSALEVDLTGQVCMDSVGDLFYSGTGDQVDFLRGSAMSKGGFSIIALPSTARGGTVSRIAPHLSKGAGVATTRGDVNFVVTEYGIAELQGKSIYQRVMELAQVAHPDFREDLIRQAKKRHYIFADQLPPSREDLLFLESYKSILKLKNGKTIELRPLVPSDEFSYRNFFYSLRQETIFHRFFYNIKLFPHETIQKHWAGVDYRKNMSLIGLTRTRGHKEIMAIGSYAMDEDDTRAEVAFVVREDFQSLGIASYLMDALQKIARENGYKGFTATVLKTNASMLRIFKKKFPSAKMSSSIDGFEIIADFDAAPSPDNDGAHKTGGENEK
jgi:acyl-CoA hydrolase/ribosomal protein S18 acetylase RimI-like enzyme